MSSLPSDERARHIIGLGLHDAMAHVLPGVAPDIYPRVVERYSHHFRLRDPVVGALGSVRVTRWMAVAGRVEALWPDEIARVRQTPAIKRLPAIGERAPFQVGSRREREIVRREILRAVAVPLAEHQGAHEASDARIDVNDGPAGVIEDARSGEEE